MIEELQWDSVFFNRKIGKLTQVPSERRLKGLIQQAKKKGYSYLSCRVVGGEMSAVQLLEAHGFYTVDIGAVWERKTTRFSGQPFQIREATVRDALRLEAMSAGLFREGRFYNDPFFTAEEAARLYRAWIKNSLTDETCRAYFIKESGFLICRQKGGSGDIALIGVVPGKQGRGIGSSLVRHVLSELRGNGLDTLTVRTQVRNIRAMNFYMGLGFKLQYSDTTMASMINKTECEE